MKNFDNIFDHEKRNSASERDFRRKDDRKPRFERRGGPEMFSAVCSACGKRCELPFRPTGDKPVYCSDCFSKQGGGNKRSFDRPRFQDKRRFEASGNNSEQYKEQFNAINLKLDTILNFLVSADLSKKTKRKKAEPKASAKKKKSKA